jgi:hypothetical protein
MGCGKKIAKSTGSTDTSPPSPQTASVDKNRSGDKGDKDKQGGEKANWLNDPRFKKETPERPGGSTDAGGLPGKPGLGMNISEPPGGWGGATTVAGSNKPPLTSNITNTKPVTEADMKEIWNFVDSRSGSTGKMPSIIDITSALASARTHSSDLIKDGSIVLTGAKTREAVWAYERKAATQGGWVASQNGVENLTSDELKERLPR